MSLTELDRNRINDFRTYIEDALAQDDRYGSPARHDREDDSILATRFEVGPNFWLELGVRPFIPQLRIGILTDDRWKSEELEGLIESSGDNMVEFVELGFDEAGLDWKNPPVEHFRDAGTHFYFATPLELAEIAELEADEPRAKALRMLEGYLIAFGPAVIIEDAGDDDDSGDE